VVQVNADGNRVTHKSSLVEQRPVAVTDIRDLRSRLVVVDDLTGRIAFLHPSPDDPG
jgi:hypothetical protein